MILFIINYNYFIFDYFKTRPISGCDVVRRFKLVILRRRQQLTTIWEQYGCVFSDEHVLQKQYKVTVLFSLCLESITSFEHLFFLFLKFIHVSARFYSLLRVCQRYCHFKLNWYTISRRVKLHWSRGPGKNQF